MKQETIEAVITCLTEECGYTVTGSEIIRNREALVLLADCTGVLPQRGDDLLRYLVFKATGETLVIKNDALITKINRSGFALPVLSDDQMIALAASFHRMKPLWMAFKHAHANNRPVVNRLAKLAKRHHQPLPTNVLASLTAHEFAASGVCAAAMRAATPQVVRALNAVRFYRRADNQARFYRIRNGRSFATSDTRDRSGIPLAQYEDVLLDVLRERCGAQGIQTSERIEYAFPVSEKLFVGAIPTGTRVRIPATGAHILVGIYWENGEAHHVDLDLSAIGTDGSKIGWNADWRTDERGMIYSGDVTDAPNGASEWIYGRQLDTPYLVLLNAYVAPAEQPFKIVVGYGEENGTETEYENYMIDPNRVLFSADAVCHQKQIVLGILMPSSDGMSFILTGQALGDKIVAEDGHHEITARQALMVHAQTALLLQEVLPEHPEGLDLTGTVSVDTLLALLEAGGTDDGTHASSCN
jgi:hypothetical protein